MAWSAPRTWVVGEIVTAAELNTNVRDNMLMLGGADGVGTSFPGSPVDGQPYTYVADSTNGVYWNFKWRNASSYWAFVGGPPLFNTVETSGESTSSTTYAALATAGPSIAVPFAGDYDVEIGAAIDPASGNIAYMSYDIGGTGAVDADQIIATNPGGTAWYWSVGRIRRKTLTAVTLTAKYKVDTASTANFGKRWMALTPVKK